MIRRKGYKHAAIAPESRTISAKQYNALGFRVQDLKRLEFADGSGIEFTEDADKVRILKINASKSSVAWTGYIKIGSYAYLHEDYDD